MKKVLFLAAVMCCALIAQAAEGGALTGKFSVAEGKQVIFSQGNLQYQPVQNAWRFAERQFDFVGGNVTKGNVSYAFDDCSNCLIGPRYDCWIDLFGWGTGDAPVLAIEDAKEYYTFNDWGNNTVMNGGFLGQAWRTLTWEEWFYLLVTRPNAAQLRSQATVDDVHGYILLPDDWQLPKKMKFTPEANNWKTNEYSEKQWKKMEKAGAVFLPAGGFRNGKEMSVVGVIGFYWSSTVFTPESGAEDEARDFFFSEKRIGPRDHEKRFYGLSVRLVEDVR
ncbi:MAG: hypothetical protein J6T80_01175 [Paludibacteraceae bacterium]|nr:hypothetical protein [Paludibacteraceae bacterium]